MTIETEPRVGKPLPRPRRTSSSGTVVPSSPVTPAPPRVPGRRNPRWIALGVVALCLGGLLSYVIYAKVAAQAAVVVMAHTVHRGAVISGTDLTTATISGTVKTSSVPADRLSTLVGHRAVYDLVAGSLVPAAAVGDTPVPDTGRAVVGLKLAQGRAPADLLVSSAPVRLVALPPTDQPANAPSTPTATYFARVIDRTDAADGTSMLVDVDVSATDAPAIALLAAQDRIAVLRDADK